MNSSLDRHRSNIQALSSRITALWTVFLLGTLFHTQLGLMPLFHEGSVLESHTDSVLSMGMTLWLMLIFFSLPLLCIVGMTITTAHWFRTMHFYLTLLYSGLNLVHLLLDAWIIVPGYQIALMTLLFFVGLLLNGVGYRWMTSKRPRLQPDFPS